LHLKSRSRFNRFLDEKLKKKISSPLSIILDLNLRGSQKKNKKKLLCIENNNVSSKIIFGSTCCKL
jgi:hypothetical protein